MGVSTKASNEKQRQRANKMSMKDYMEGRASAEKPPISRDQKKCIHCGFKAMYSFKRCPECDKAF